MAISCRSIPPVAGGISGSCGIESIVFDLAPERLAIGADTAGYEISAQNRLSGLISKVWVIPRLRFVLCGRGIVDIGLKAYCELAVAPAIVHLTEQTGQTTCQTTGRRMRLMR